MDNRFFEQPVINSPYEYPSQHWELDEHGQPTQKIIENRRRAEFTEMFSIKDEFNKMIDSFL